MKSFLIVAAILGGFVAIAVAYGVSTWESIGPTAMGFHGWFALVLMVVLTLGVGIGLMGLMFYSSRKGYDEHQDLPFDE